ncbi:MAG: assembly factor cbp4 [Icmadophila ericetorum]|nr:assembly factor cbp4 [Icmadophila ericetorum]
MSKVGLYLKMFAAGAVCCIGGPWLIYAVSPTEEELFKVRYNPELQKRSLENREGKQQDFDNFVNKLKEYSRSNKPIWEAAAEDEARQRAKMVEEQRLAQLEIQKRRDEIKRQALSSR